VESQFPVAATALRRRTGSGVLEDCLAPGAIEQQQQQRRHNNNNNNNNIIESI
jgi:hypothetical protein